MFKFAAEQKIYDIGGMKIGGQPGQFPTVLMGSIFYKGDRLVLDDEKGEFDREGAFQCISQAEKICKSTNIPLVVDIVGSTQISMNNYVKFVGENTELPFLIDGTTEGVRLAGAKKAAELGLQDRAIFNCIGPETKQGEMDVLKSLELKNTMVMLVNTKKPTAKGRVDIAEGLIEKAYDAGFEQLLLDTAVLDIVEPGPAGKAIWMLKEKYGYPCGCSPTHNVRDRWKRASDYSIMGQAAAKTSLATSLQLMGADFMMYAIKQTEIIPAIGMVDAIVAYTAAQHGIRPQGKKHPLYTIFG